MIFAVEYVNGFRQAAVDRGIPSEEVEKFIGLLRFVICTSVTPSGAPVGKLGGLPPLPVGMKWPSFRGYPLPFVASFDCAALPRLDGLELPEDGSLLIFLHHEDAADADSIDDEQEHARLMHVPAGVATEEPAEPEVEPDTFARPRDFVAAEQLLFATVYGQWPEWLDVEESDLPEFQRQAARELPHRRQLCALAAELWPEQWPYHPHIGGYPQIEWRFREHVNEIEEAHRNAKNTATPETLRADGWTSAPSEQLASGKEDEYRIVREWVSLVRFLPDEFHEARFMIHREDLAAGRLDKVLSCTEFLE